MRHLFPALTVLIVLASSVQAGTTVGTIRGQILDAQTQKPLLGIHIHLEGTDRSVVSDENGSYVFLNVSPGVHTLTVPRSTEDVWQKTDIKVLAGFTTTFNFSLQEKDPNPAPSNLPILVGIGLFLIVWPIVRIIYRNHRPQQSNASFSQWSQEY
ncbi:MAG: carboxypeptidase-like regulatory domain-containing protein [bacterium]|nr:carboxypeptidase-like regulatory domain-containing protein [bacterium]